MTELFGIRNKGSQVQCAARVVYVNYGPGCRRKRLAVESAAEPIRIRGVRSLRGQPPSRASSGLGAGRTGIRVFFAWAR